MVQFFKGAPPEICDVLQEDSKSKTEQGKTMMKVLFYIVQSNT